MKKRLRKKLGRKEFYRNVFPVSLTLTLSEQDPEGTQFWSRLEEWVEATGLLVIGNINCFNIFPNYNTVPPPLVTDKDRIAVKNWLQEQPEVVYFIIGPRGNNWRPYFKQDDQTSLTLY